MRLLLESTHESSADDPASQHEGEMKQMRRDEEATMEQKVKYKKEIALF